jgi:hypothetical protein
VCRRLGETKGAQQEQRIKFFQKKRKQKSSIGNRSFAHHRRESAVDFVSDGVSYTVLRGHCFNIIVLNVHATSEEKSDDSKDSFYEQLVQVFKIIFVSSIRKFYQEILRQKRGERIFSNQQLGMTAYIRIVMIMVLE